MKRLKSIELFFRVILIFCFTIVCPEGKAANATLITHSGRNLSSEEVLELEKGLLVDASDLTARMKLLGYYFGKDLRSTEIRETRQEHVMWLIEHAPEAEVLGTPFGTLSHYRDGEVFIKAKKLLLAKIQEKPDNLARLKNGANFFTLNERSQSIELLQKGELLDGTDPYWPKTLGQAHLLNTLSHSLHQQRVEAAKALAAFQRAHKISTERGKGSILVSLAKAAFIANELDLASGYAIELVRDGGAGSNVGNRSHHGNIILGRIAITRGRIDVAKEHLIAAGETSGSPQLNSFGPDMKLARELLKVDENKVVLEYFELCRKFWKNHRGRLDDWKASVESGRIPEFGSAL